MPENINNDTFTASAPAPGAAIIADTMLDYRFAEGRMRPLVDKWLAEEVKRTEYRRRMRDIKVDVKALRERGQLKSDETYIPIRLLDTNIRREQPPQIQYLTQSRRCAVFKCNTQPQHDASALEGEFTRVMRYEDWEVPFIRVLDGAALHGWDSVEVVFDDKKPGGVAIEHVGHENLVMPFDARSLEQCEYFLRIFHVSAPQLKAFVRDFGFNQVEVEKLIRLLEGDVNTTSGTPYKSRSDSMVMIFKLFFKLNGQVYVAWYSKECSDWLKVPEPLYVGVQQQSVEMVIDPITGMPTPQQKWTPTPEYEYPVKILYYQEGEKPEIFDHHGRAHLDEYKQEAVSATWSAFINGTLRASNVYGSPANQTDTGGAAPKQLEVVLEHGRMYDAPMSFFNAPYPDPVMLKAAQALDTQNSQETNQVAWAVNNREDSRKTATEIEAAQNQTVQINSVSVLMLSGFLRRVYKQCWRIVQSLALQNKIVFLQSASPETNGVPTNNAQQIAMDYTLRPAGDVDVIEKQEKLSKMMQFWGVVQTVPGLNQVFLSDIIKTAFPEDGDRYIMAMMQGSPKNGVIQSLGALVKSLVAVTPEAAEFAPQLAQIEQQAQAALASPV